jgi:hypothetical protein
MPTFARYIGIDYSGAQTPSASLKHLRVYLTESAAPPVEVPPPPSPRKYWTRRGIAKWLVERFAEDPLTLVGMTMVFRSRCAILRCTGLQPLRARLTPSRLVTREVPLTKLLTGPENPTARG